MSVFFLWLASSYIRFILVLPQLDLRKSRKDASLHDKRRESRVGFKELSEIIPFPPVFSSEKPVTT